MTYTYRITKIPERFKVDEQLATFDLTEDQFKVMLQVLAQSFLKDDIELAREFAAFSA